MLYLVSVGWSLSEGVGLIIFIHSLFTLTHLSLLLHSIPSTIIGRWQGDSIAIVGDYAKSGLYDMCEDENGKPKNGWKDISIPTYRTLLKDTWIGSRKAEEIKKHGTKWMFGEEHKLMLELFPKECTEGDLRQKFDFVEKEQSEE